MADLRAKKLAEQARKYEEFKKDMEEGREKEKLGL